MLRSPKPSLNPTRDPTSAARSLAIGSGPSRALSVAISTVLGMVVTMGAPRSAEGVDILRARAGGQRSASGAASVSGRNGTPNGPESAAAAAQAAINSRESLARTDSALAAVRNMQAAARAAAQKGPNNAGTYRGAALPNVTDGLGKGGLQPAPGVPKNLSSVKPGEDRTLWRGASLPTQAQVKGRTQVTIKQNQAQAVLNWETFNVGKNTTLKFDQSAGGNRRTEWIAFNKVNDPTGKPSQILGSIEADGQVYVINRNGIIFGGASQVNTRALVASSLPINDNLIQSGLLNNPDAQFLFSALPQSAGEEGTPASNPKISDAKFSVSSESASYTLAEAVAVNAENVPLAQPELKVTPPGSAASTLISNLDYVITVNSTTRKATVTFTAAGIAKIAGAPVSVTYTPTIVKSGDVVVRAGAVLRSPVSGDGNGGRVMLVGSNVANEGTISTPSGQTILTAGSQVSVAAHAGNDPSLRGLDAWVGTVADSAGSVTNSGIVEALTGSAMMVGRRVEQLGVLESSTSVNLNGRFDIRASYGALSAPKFESGGPQFFFQETGLVLFGEDSVTRILPDYLSERTVPGMSLPERSQINIDGKAIHFGVASTLLAPNADVTIRAGTWPSADIAFNRDQGAFRSIFFTGNDQRFLLNGGQIYVDRSALLSVAGSTDVFVPLSQSVQEVEFRGPELADSPLQRDGVLRSVPLTVDLRNSGTYGGRYWIGTPLADATGFAALVQRNVGQLTVDGGTLSLRSGESLVVAADATLDVSGGYYRHEGGFVQTSRLLRDGRLVEVSDALPNQVYDGVYSGKFTVSSAKWGVTETFGSTLLTGQTFQPEYMQGASGGTLDLAAPSMAVDGELRGATIQGPREGATAPGHSSLKISFVGEKVFTGSTTPAFLETSPYAPRVSVENSGSQAVPEAFAVNAENTPFGLSPERIASAVFTPELLSTSGFGSLSISNPDGEIVVGKGVNLVAPASGTVVFTGANILVEGTIAAPAGSLEFTAFNISPLFTSEFTLRAQLPNRRDPAPLPNVGRGAFTLGPSARLTTAGLVVDQREEFPIGELNAEIFQGGSIQVTAFDANFAAGSAIDVSGGVLVSRGGDVVYGDAGSISIIAGQDPGFGKTSPLGKVLGGRLTLGSTLQGYSGTSGGSLTLQTSLVQIGGSSAFPDVLVLEPEFFRQGGFTDYRITATGVPSDKATINDTLGSYRTAFRISDDITIEPVAERLIAKPFGKGAGGLALDVAILEQELRDPVNVEFAVVGMNDPETDISEGAPTSLLEVQSDLVFGRGARIVTDPGASVKLSGNRYSTITVLGSVTAPGGSIEISGPGAFPIAPSPNNGTFARATVYIGPDSRLDAAGVMVSKVDEFGREVGKVLAGGSVSLSGNIVASGGSIFDVSGATGVTEVHPYTLGEAVSPFRQSYSSMTGRPWGLRSVELRTDTDGGTISLEGGEMMFSNAEMLGQPGGATAVGGMLSVSSGRFYESTATRSSDDINLIVTQSNSAISGNNTDLGVGKPVLQATGMIDPGMGYFSVGAFFSGDFSSLDLGYNSPAGSPLAGGNVEFRGPVNITAKGSLRVAGGGYIKADSNVLLKSSYLAFGLPFPTPGEPQPDFPGQVVPGAASATAYRTSPTFGAGSIAAQASLIDVGTLTLKDIGRADFFAAGGDIRGSGTLSVAGDISFRAAQVYPTTLSTFSVFGYDRNVLVSSSAVGSADVTLASAQLPPGFGVGTSLLGSTVKTISGKSIVLESGANATISTNTTRPFLANSGSVSFYQSGSSPAPLSIGGNLNVFSASISQGGTIRAPLGSITLGWDGTDFDPSDSDFDQPFNAIAQLPDAVTLATSTAPVNRRVVLHSGSLTSVEMSDLGGDVSAIPFGISPDGFSWIDPLGRNVTTSGLPAKQISVRGDAVLTKAGSKVDIRGGGDLYAYRWVAGNGGSVDILGGASGAWVPSTEYKAGDLVSFDGETWSARVRNTGQTPDVSIYWTRLNESFAILPGYQPSYAPFAPFNAKFATSLGGDPGLVSSGLQIGDQIYLDGSDDVSRGVYTLLPQRYALLPGAILVTPGVGAGVSGVSLVEGGSYTSSYRVNQFNRAGETQQGRAIVEITPGDVVRQRASYEDYYANSFFREAAERLEVPRPQSLPMDSGYLALHGNHTLRPEGAVLTARPEGGRGASVDLSSFADIYVVGGKGTVPANATAVVKDSLVNSWGVESLLIGGLRRQTATGTEVELRTTKLVLDNEGSSLLGPDITLGSRGELSVMAGSSISSSGEMSGSAESLRIAWIRNSGVAALDGLTGDGAVVRVSSDTDANITRARVTASTDPLLRLGANVNVTGSGVTLDSTSGSLVDSSANISAYSLTLGAGQISIILEGPSTSLEGETLNNQLVLAGPLLKDVEASRVLTLRSYGSVDVYGGGVFGGAALNALSIFSGGIRGYRNQSEEAIFRSATVLFSNPGGIGNPFEPMTNGGSLRFDGQRIQIGSNAFAISGYSNVTLNASDNFSGVGTGSFTTTGDLTISAPMIRGTSQSRHDVVAAGSVTLAKRRGVASGAAGIGSSLSFSGTTILANSNILLPSGSLTLRARTGDLTIGGSINAAGTQQRFYDLIRFTDAGTVSLFAAEGQVSVLDSARITVAAPATGGDAGTVIVSAPKGSFALSTLAKLSGRAAGGESAGSFALDTLSLSSFDGLSQTLNLGGFLEQINVRVRTGDVTIGNSLAGQTHVARDFTVSADTGSITVLGTIDASSAGTGSTTGGKIVLAAGGSLTLADGSQLTVRADDFSNAGKGGEIRLEAGVLITAGSPNLAARLTLEEGSRIDLGVDAFRPGDYKTVGSSASLGRFEGTLHLRAPRNAANNDLGIAAIGAEVTGGSSILVEGFQVLDRTAFGGTITGTRTLPNTMTNPSSLPTSGVQRDVYNSAVNFFGSNNTNYQSMITRLLDDDSQGLSGRLVLAPGVEIINTAGDVTLGTETSTASSDWDLSDFRFGPKQAAGVLTLRAKGNVVFLNALSDGFRADPVGTAGGISLPTGTLAGQALWLSPLMRINDALPTNTQSWSFRIAAGADLGAADFRSVLPTDQLVSGGGSVRVGKFYNTNQGTTGTNATTNASINNRYQVIRTGTGDITISAGRDVQIRNQFATIYTAGVSLPNPSTVINRGDFSVPIVALARDPFVHPSQGTLGGIQQIYSPQWSMAGGDVVIAAAGNIETVRRTSATGPVVVDASSQLPTNWLYRRGYVDPSTGLFGAGGVNESQASFNDPSASTAWWVDFSNFFEGVGALGGGDVSLIAGANVTNVDGVIPTNARMAGRRATEFDQNGVPIAFENVGPDTARMVQLGGGDLKVRSGNDIDGGVYYVERGRGDLFAAGAIKTNSARNVFRGPNPPDIALPTTLFLGDAQFDVTARGDVLLGPVSNAFLLPQGLNNKFWYKTYFNTFSEDTAVSIESFGGSITHRLAAPANSTSTNPQPILRAWLENVNLFTVSTRSTVPSFSQPWLRLAETNLTSFNTVLSLNAPSISSTAFSGDINIVGDLTLYPSATGDLEFAASGSVLGLQSIGRLVSGSSGWTAGSVNVSDADPSAAPRIVSPLAYQSVVGRAQSDANQSGQNPFVAFDRLFNETGSITGANASFRVQQSLHSASVLHEGDPNPVRIYASSGDITGLTLFTPKAAQIFAGNDITDIAFYLQNVGSSDVSIVSAGRDIVAFNENSALRAIAGNLLLGNVVSDPFQNTTAGTQTQALSGDVQVSGPGVLEVLAGRDLDLGTGANLVGGIVDGTGVGLSSIGNRRNPNLPFTGASIIALAGVTGEDGVGAAIGLVGSSLDFDAFNEQYGNRPLGTTSEYLSSLDVSDLDALTLEQQAIAGLEVFFGVLRDAGRNFAASGNYEDGFAAIDSLFGEASGRGEIFTRAREMRTSAGGGISVAVPTGGLTMASDIFGNPLTPPGIVTEFGGGVSIFTDQGVDIGQARIFTLRGGDITIWASEGDIAAGTASRTVVTAPPTRVIIEVSSADVQTDLGGLATGGGIGVLATVAGVEPGDVDLIAPTGIVDAGDAGIRVTGNLNISATAVLNASNIQVGGASTGVPSAPVVAAPSLGALTSAGNASSAAGAAAEEVAKQAQQQSQEQEEVPSIITVEVIGYGGGDT